MTFEFSWENPESNTWFDIDPLIYAYEFTPQLFLICISLF